VEDAAAERAPAILVVEDDDLVGRALARLLRAFGEVEVVRGASQARAALGRRRWGGMLVDVGLPDGDGLELAREALEQRRAAEVLVLSGHVDRDRLRRAHALGVGYLVKPALEEDLRLFAHRARGVRLDALVRAAVEEWRERYELTDAVADVLGLAAAGASRAELHELRGVSEETIKKQVRSLITATGDATLEAAVSRLLREAMPRAARRAPSRATG